MVIYFIRKSKSLLRAPNFLGSFGQKCILLAKDVGKVMISLNAGCNAVPHTPFQKLNTSVLLARMREETYWANDNITDGNATHILKQLNCTAQFNSNCRVRLKKMGKGLRSHLVHFHCIDKKAEVLGGSFSKASFLPKTRNQLSWLPCLNTSRLA